MTRRMIAPLVLGLVCVAILIGLGIWQLQRLEWKRGVLAEMDARLAAEPVAVPAAPDLATDRYLRVAAEGTIQPGEIHVYTATGDGRVGYRVIAPFALAGGRRILIDRGFVPIADKDAARPAGPVSVTGNLVWPDEGAGDPDRAKNIWIARDLPLMAADLGAEPVLLVAATPTGGTEPLPVTVAIPNNHLQYAVTWFGLASAWTLMTGLWLWRIKRGTD